jgi:hypothetical protein
MNEKFERASEVQDGYWYTFGYKALKDDPTYDKTPFILCLGPGKNINCFVGINFHRVPLQDRVNFLLFLNEHFNMTTGDERIVDFVTSDGLKLKFPQVRSAIRTYNRTQVQNCYRVPGCEVGKYIEYDGDFMMKEPSAIMNQYWRDYAANVSPEGSSEL